MCAHRVKTTTGKLGRDLFVHEAARAHVCEVCVRGLGSGESERRYQAAHGSFLKGGSIGSYFIWLHVLQGRLLTFIYFKTIA